MFALAGMALMALAWPAAAAERGAAWTPEVVAFWRSHPAGAVVGDNPSANAPGVFNLKPAFVSGASQAGATAAEAALLTRRLQVALDALMSQPSLRDPHGVSVQSAINIRRINTDDGRGALSATLNIISRPIRLDDSGTLRDAAGRYATPGEGATLLVTLNPTDFLRERDILGAEPFASGVRLIVGSSTAILLADKPLAPGWSAPALGELWSHDRAWTTSAGGPGAAPMLIYLGASRQENERLFQDRLPPTNNVGRLAAAIWMVDWAQVRAQMLAVR